LVLFSSFGAIGAELKCGVHSHQVFVTSSSKRGLCHDKKSERAGGNTSTQPNSNKECNAFRMVVNEHTVVSHLNDCCLLKLIVVSVSEGAQTPSSVLIVGCNMVFGPAFGHNSASGLAFGHNLASGPAFGHNMSFGPAFGHNMAFGLAFGHSKLIKLIGRVGHINSLVNRIGCFGPKIQTQLIVNLSPATNSEGTRVPSFKLIVGYHHSKISLRFCNNCRIFCEGVQGNGNGIIEEHPSG
jgi:hypothetical protein